MTNSTSSKVDGTRSGLTDMSAQREQSADRIFEQMQNHQFLFLGGLHRSGTSLAFRCLRDHPEISGFRDTGAPEDEGQHLQSVYPKAFRHGGPAKFGFHHAMYLDENSPLVTSTNRRKLYEEWSRYWDIQKSVFLEKSPPNLIKSRFLQAIFPNTFFIFIMRHPAAVTFATRKWKPRMRLSKFVEHWLICHERMQSDLNELDRSMVFRYEDFVHEPNETLANIYKFVGLDTIETSQEVRSHVNRDYFNMWRRAGRGAIARFRMNRLIDRFEARCNAFGYSLRALSDPDSDGRV